jgi:hypothetical protein
LPLTLAELLAAEHSDRGGPVVAIDADSVPGLPQVLGFPPGDDRFLAGMAELKDGGWSLDDEGGWLVVDLQGGTLQVSGGMWARPASTSWWWKLRHVAPHRPPLRGHE